MRGLAIATYTATLRPDGTVERATLTLAGRRRCASNQKHSRHWRRRLNRGRSPAGRADAAADTIAVAREGGLALWCDDSALRQKARQAGVAAFSLLDLITSLRHGKTIDQPSLVAAWPPSTSRTCRSALPPCPGAMIRRVS